MRGGGAGGAGSGQLVVTGEGAESMREYVLLAQRWAWGFSNQIADALGVASYGRLLEDSRVRPRAQHTGCCPYCHCTACRECRA